MNSPVFWVIMTIMLSVASFAYLDGGEFIIGGIAVVVAGLCFLQFLATTSSRSSG